MYATQNSPQAAPLRKLRLLEPGEIAPTIDVTVPAPPACRPDPRSRHPHGRGMRTRSARLHS